MHHRYASYLCIIPNSTFQGLAACTVTVSSCCASTLSADYHWLEEVNRVDDNAKRHRPPIPRKELPQHLGSLVHQARLRGVRLLIMAPGTTTAAADVICEVYGPYSGLCPDQQSCSRTQQRLTTALTAKAFPSSSQTCSTTAPAPRNDLYLKSTHPGVGLSNFKE